MIFIYTTYEYLLGEKQLKTTTKKNLEPEEYTLQIFTPARKFLGLPFGGGLVKVSKLIDKEGKIVHARHYSPELKAEISRFKKEFTIPYFQLWKGMIFIMAGLIIASIIFSLKNKVASANKAADVEHMIENLSNPKAGQLYGASFFLDENGQQLPELSDGWIRVSRVEEDTVFMQRSIQIMPTKSLFSLEAIQQIRPATDADWNPKEEKISLPLLKKDLSEEGIQKVNMMYIGADYELNSGVVFTIQAAE